MVYLRYPANIPHTPGHSWADAVAMRLPIAHKGSAAGAKVQALTALDLMLSPETLQKAWAYYKEVQTKELQYTPLIAPDDQPAIDMNKEKMEKFRPEMRKVYYDSSKYKTYLEQFGIQYPTVRSSRTGTITGKGRARLRPCRKLCNSMPAFAAEGRLSSPSLDRSRIQNNVVN